jgi:hypothetical protein
MNATQTAADQLAMTRTQGLTVRELSADEVSAVSGAGAKEAVVVYATASTFGLAAGYAALAYYLTR